MYLTNDIILAVSEQANTHNTHLDLKSDKANLDGFIASMGVGCESLPDTPAASLINKMMHDKYPDHCRLSQGNEAMMMLIGLSAALAIGINAFKGYLRKKKSPASSAKTAEVIAKVKDTYTDAWIEGKESVDKPVSAGKLTKLFAGLTFGDVKDNVTGILATGVKESEAAVAYIIEAWKKIEPFIDKIKNASDEEEVKKLVAEMKTIYKTPPASTYPPINTRPKPGAGGKLSALSTADYKTAADLLLALVVDYEKVDSLLFDDLQDVGFWDLDIPKDSPATIAEDVLWEYGNSEGLVNWIGSDLFRLRSIYLEAAQGLEEYINNSFK